MDRLSTLDAEFLHLEDGLTHLHIAGISVFDGPAPPLDDLLGLLAAGTPTLVSDADAFAELPGDAVVKIAPDATEADRLRAALTALLDDADRRTQMGRAAAAYIAQACGPDTVARRYVDFAGALLADLLAPPVFPVRPS